jgi:hypothetical protein
VLRRQPLLTNERKKTVRLQIISFLNDLMNRFFSTWNCPVCDQAALYENLVIDGYFQDVIFSQKLGQDDNEIQLHPDGSWSTLSNKPDLYSLETPKKSIQKVEVISDDLGKLRNMSKNNCLSNMPVLLEMITEDFPKSNIKNLTGSNPAAGKPQADTVDLTIDSDEDEEALKNSKAPVKSKNGM